MAFASWSDFIAMGGYSFYVWLAYGVSLFSVLLLVISTVAKRKKIFKHVEQRLLREQRIKAAENREGTL
ncbi:MULTISPECIES: heme exporter protein CcmD [Psychromonas]|uniref:heme exporter protein CcmD n=1 Tax=Psychromonas TaxID=67572 RepID=UPI0004180035|nr:MULTISPECIES: heme exporter protein CcmD [Psychromonas]MBB1271658.1 heme exporter protein CcmD [Psychromonas sp. SR45-3]